LDPKSAPKTFDNYIDSKKKEELEQDLHKWEEELKRKEEVK